MDDRMVEETLSLAKISELIKRKISFCSKEKKKEETRKIILRRLVTL